ncbi:MAG: SDR family NAD(P)-dependent oxidoreductase, partial [Pirellulaceae bacterium]
HGTHVLLVCPGPIARDDQGMRYHDRTAGLPASANRPGGGVKLRGLAPSRLAAAILAACERRQAELILPAKARLLFALMQCWPRLGDWLIRRATS